MTSVRILPSGPFDGDVATQLDLIETLPRIQTFDEDPIRENRLALVLASAFRLLRDRPIECPIVTAGEAALQAASIAWRGPIVHLSSAPLSRVEASLLRRTRATPTRLVTSSHTDAAIALRRGVGAAGVTVIRPALPSISLPDRAAVRQRLGLAVGQPAILVPGTVRRGSGHRLALWAAGILISRDPNARLLVRTDPRGATDRFAEHTILPNTRLSADRLTDLEIAAAADVAISVPERAPQISSLLACLAAGTPIVSTRDFWSRERLPETGVRLLDDPKARLLARAALQAIESPRPVGTRASDTELARRQWLGVIHDVCGLSSLASGSAA